jgi:hypothetical protein
MEDKYIKIPSDYQSLFPIAIDNMRVELTEDIQGDKYVSERCLNWSDFLNKLDKNSAKKEELTPFYEYAKAFKAVEIELITEDNENIF